MDPLTEQQPVTPVYTTAPAHTYTKRKTIIAVTLVVIAVIGYVAYRHYSIKQQTVTERAATAQILNQNALTPTPQEKTDAATALNKLNHPATPTKTTGKKTTPAGVAAQSAVVTADRTEAAASLNKTH